MQACKWCGSPVAKVVPKHLDEDRSWVGGYIQFACSSEFWNESSKPFWDRTLVCRLAEKDARIASLEAEVERQSKTLAAIRAKFAKLSEEPSVAAIVQQAYMCVLFVLDYPDKIVADYEEPPHAP